jgi:hypothetical protein
MSRTKSFEEATDSLLAGSANAEWRTVNSKAQTYVSNGVISTKKQYYYHEKL